MPVCIHCKKKLQETEFHRQGNGKRRSICKYCTNARNVEYRERDKAKGKRKPKTERNPIASIPPWPEQIKMGEELTVEWDIDGRGATKQIFTFVGEVIYLDRNKVIIKGKNYKYSLDRIDLLMNRARLV